MGKNGCVKVGGTDMYYVAFGKGDKNLTVLPGLSDGLATVKGKAMLLSSPYKKFLNDYKVYIFSRKNDMPEGYGIRDMAEDQVTALKELGIDKTSILGVSQGGMIAQYIAISHPEVCDRLVLAVTAPYANDIVRGAVTGWISMLEKDDYKAMMTDSAEKTYTESYMRKNRGMIGMAAKLTKPKSYERFFRNANAILGFDARDELHKIKCPTLILSGDDDKTVGNDAPYEMNKLIEGSSMYIYEGFGHGLFEEAGDFYGRVFDFV